MRALKCHHAGCIDSASGSSSACAAHATPRGVKTKQSTCVSCGQAFQQPSSGRASTCSQECKALRRRSQQSQWKQSNADRVSKAGAARHAANAEHIRAYIKQWRMSNPDRTRVLKRHSKRTRRIREDSAKFRVTQRDLSRSIRRHGGCAYCNGALDGLHWDHVVPLSRGGATSIGNLVPSCPTCNMQKGARTVMEWRVAASRN